jgi:hypothetical protein
MGDHDSKFGLDLVFFDKVKNMPKMTLDRLYLTAIKLPQTETL